MDTSDGGREGGREEEELLDRTLPLSTLPCRAEEAGQGGDGREGDVRVRVGLIRHDRTRLGAPSIIRTGTGANQE